MQAKGRFIFGIDGVWFRLGEGLKDILALVTDAIVRSGETEVAKLDGAILVNENISWF